MAPDARAGAALDPLADRPLARATLGFYLRPSLHADPGWLRLTPPPGPGPLQRAVDRALAQEHGLAACFAEPQPPAARLFLIDRPALQAIVLALGLAAHRQALRCTVLRAHRSALERRFGSVLEAVWMPLARSVPPVDQAQADADPARYTADGWEVSLQLLDPQRDGPGNQRRARLCAPPRLPARPPLPPAEAQALTDVLLTEALPRWAPAWTSLF